MPKEQNNIVMAFAMFSELDFWLLNSECITTITFGIVNLIGKYQLTLNCVSAGVLARKGGEPTSISYKMTPTLHQSHNCV
jgi:hypothetical protein